MGETAEQQEGEVVGEGGESHQDRKCAAVGEIQSHQKPDQPEEQGGEKRSGPTGEPDLEQKKVGELEQGQP